MILLCGCGNGVYVCIVCSSGINRSFSEFDNQEVGREISRSIKEQLYSLSFIGLTVSGLSITQL